ncbi:MAG TPA: excalibur calcium-binding domain-containing protein [Arthrobacter sp.]
MRIRRQADLGEGKVQPVGCPGRARRDGQHPGRLLGPARAHQRAGAGRTGACTRGSPPAPAPVAPAPVAPALAPAAPAAVCFANCTTAKAAGAALLRIGRPGYSSGLDGDSDGVACER